MERERQPDREGYLDFCRRVEDGDHELAGKAELLSKASQPEALGQYHRMREIEGAIEQMSREDVGEVVHVYEMSSLSGLRDNRIRMDALDKMSKVVEDWDVERCRNHASYNEFHKANDFRYATAERRHQHPRESEAQAWFQAKSEVEAAHLDRMIEHRQVLDRQLDALSRSARSKDRGERKRGRKFRWSLEAEGVVALSYDGTKIAYLEPNFEGKRRGLYLSHIADGLPGGEWNAVDFKDLRSGQKALEGWAQDHARDIKTIVRDAKEGRQQKVYQLGDPGYAEWREQQRGKDRGGRER